VHHADSQEEKVDQLIPRIRDEYTDWPRLALTVSQAARLWNTDPRTCEAALQMLARVGFLTRRHDDRFARTSAPSQSWSPAMSAEEPREAVTEF
jgi:hypothetical protein